jgi:hypothetical protein
MNILNWFALCLGYATMVAGGLGLVAVIADWGITAFLSFIGSTPRTWFDILCEMQRSKRFRWHKRDGQAERPDTDV